MKLLKFVILILVVRGVVGVAYPHEPLHTDGNCHTPYDDPDDCRHPCDNTLCDCIEDCKTKCPVIGVKECIECKGTCLRGNAKCVNACWDKEHNK